MKGQTDDRLLEDSDKFDISAKWLWKDNNLRHFIQNNKESKIWIEYIKDHNDQEVYIYRLFMMNQTDVVLQNTKKTDEYLILGNDKAVYVFGGLNSSNKSVEHGSWTKLPQFQDCMLFKFD